MVLYRKSRFAFYPNSFYGLIVEIDMCDFNQIRVAYILRNHTKTMILAGNLATVGDQVFDRMVATTVAIEHFFGTNAIGKGEQLMAQTDPKHRAAGSNYFTNRFHCIIHGRRISGTIGTKVAIL